MADPPKTQWRVWDAQTQRWAVLPDRMTVEDAARDSRKLERVEGSRENVAR